MLALRGLRAARGIAVGWLVGWLVGPLLRVEVTVSFGVWTGRSRTLVLPMSGVHLLFSSVPLPPLHTESRLGNLVIDPVVLGAACMLCVYEPIENGECRDKYVLYPDRPLCLT